MKTSSILKLGGIVHNEAEEPIVNNINSKNNSTLESKLVKTSSDTNLIIDHPSQALCDSNNILSVGDKLISNKQISLDESPCTDNLVPSQDNMFNEKHNKSVCDVIVTKENCTAHNEQTVSIPFYSTTVPHSSIDTNMSQDIT